VESNYNKLAQNKNSYRKRGTSIIRTDTVSAYTQIANFFLDSFLTLT